MDIHRQQTNVKNMHLFVRLFDANFRMTWELNVEHQLSWAVCPLAFRFDLKTHSAWTWIGLRELRFFVFTSVSMENTLSASAFEFGRDRIVLISLRIMGYCKFPSVSVVATIVFHASSKSKCFNFSLCSNVMLMFKNCHSFRSISLSNPPNRLVTKRISSIMDPCSSFFCCRTNFGSKIINLLRNFSLTKVSDEFLLQRCHRMTNN